MIVELEQYKTQLEELRKTLAEAGEGMHLDLVKNELTELKEEMAAPGFWDDLDRSTAVNRRIAKLQTKLDHFSDLNAQCEDIETMVQLSEEEEDKAMAQEAGELLASLAQKVEELSIETLMQGDYDHCNAILSLHAGAGGTEAQDWTQMLYRMYTRYC